MPEKEMPVEDLFANPDFGVRFTGWQRAVLDRDRLNGLVYDAVAAFFSDTGRDEAELGETISYYAETTPTELAEAGNILPDDASSYINMRASADATQLAEREAILKFSEQSGLEPFALFGLRAHLRPSDDIASTALLAKVKATEANLQTVDELVRKNPGELLTVIEHPMAIYAGIIGEGGLTFTEEGGVMIPQTDAKACSAALSMRETDVYPDRDFVVSSRSFTRAEPDILSPEVFIDDTHRWNTSATAFVVGALVEGPLHVEPAEIERNLDYFNLLLGRVRAVGHAATNN